ncbi:unnamed protein product [Coffea canephora]|uniref:Uncharacterized protein n=1 Tax=Coffea canephora TaxID=49390 RepID=A0A068UFW1_COFCA|nr:unnamed protein product [Coffea canephora]
MIKPKKKNFNFLLLLSSMLLMAWLYLREKKLAGCFSQIVSTPLPTENLQKYIYIYI